MEKEMEESNSIAMDEADGSTMVVLGEAGLEADGLHPRDPTIGVGRGWRMGGEVDWRIRRRGHGRPFTPHHPFLYPAVVVREGRRCSGGSACSPVPFPLFGTPPPTIDPSRRYRQRCSHPSMATPTPPLGDLVPLTTMAEITPDRTVSNARRIPALPLRLPRD
jgi:hypothetical protein